MRHGHYRRRERWLALLVALAVLGAVWLIILHVVGEGTDVLGCTWDSAVGASEECHTDG